jgi:alginate O-acetyltransferase complex protein AlgI
MWVLAFNVYVGLKWLTWWQARTRISPPAWYSVAYLFAWPGMDAELFLDSSQRVPPSPLQDWFWSLFDAALGATCVWVVARVVPAACPLLRGWVGMLGIVLVLHFGAFRFLAVVWQACGIRAIPIMLNPLHSRSLSEFWGKRWNLGFRQLAHDLVFRPLHRKLGAGGAGFLVFILSGLIHDCVISVPARAGYGLPTLYFAAQGIGVTIERSSLGKTWAATGDAWLDIYGNFYGGTGLLAISSAFCAKGDTPVYAGNPRAMNNEMLTRFFDLDLWLAGAGHFVILIASAQVPSRLRWREDLR